MKLPDGNGTNHALWACWNKPSVSIPEADYLLSFLSPQDELDYDQTFYGRLIRAREEFVKIEEEARKNYIDLVAGIGVVPYDKHRTFRQALGGAGKHSRWWWHPVSAKNCEYDPTYFFILSMMTIVSVMRDYGFEKLVLVDAPSNIARILRESFVTLGIRTGRRKFSLPIILHGLGHRLINAFLEYRNITAARRFIKKPATHFDVAFTGFWDWSFFLDNHTGKIKDRYYVKLPDAFRAKGVQSLGWFAWLDAQSGFFGKDRGYQEILEPVNRINEIAILQQFLSPLSLFKKFLNFGALMKYLRVKNRKIFKKAFQREGIDYFPLFRDELLRGFLNWSIPQGDLVEEAVQKACKTHQPRLCFTFQEHFLFSRAVYSGMKMGNKSAQRYTMQHASYNLNKTYLYFHPVTEFRGEPDGCAVPHPDKVFAMGSLGRQLFLKCGYSDDDIFLTGSPRYDNLSIRLPRLRKEWHNKLNVWIVCSLDLSIEIDMVEAVCLASEGLDHIHLMLRNHPDKRVTDHPDFGRFAHRIEVTQGNLQDELRKADLIIFTFTTVAEEAYLFGIPVWQWLPLNYDASALAAVADIPRFGSVKALRSAMETINHDKKSLSLDPDNRNTVLEKLFYREDGNAAQRIADYCLQEISFCDCQGR